MKIWLLLPATLLGGVLLCRWPTATPAVGQERLPAPVPPQFMGAGSCAAAACHGNIEHRNAGSEFTLWSTRDPHAMAYETLFEERSVRIQKNLRASAKAHDDRRCLQCHVAPDVDVRREKKAPYFRTDGVSCESCHGPAEHWLNVHPLDAWQHKSTKQKHQYGMRDTQSALGRARLCAECHVGAPGMDVDHDLIAAGHPRLNFEFTAFHAVMPRHGPDARDESFHERAWVVGQLVTARAALELLADRAGDLKKPWPEFALHDCVACHHDLTPRVAARARPSAIPFGAWELAMTPHALKAMNAGPESLQDLARELDKGFNNRNKIALSARQAARQVQSALDRLDAKTARVAPPLEIMRSVLAEDKLKGNPSWDRTSQIGLALAALQRSQLAPYPVVDRLALQRFFLTLKLPRNYDDNAALDAAAIRQTLIEFKNAASRKGF